MSNKNEKRTLADALPEEIRRVRDEVIPAYIEIGPSGQIALMMMRQSLDEATAAMMSGDVIAMIQAYKDLSEYKL